MFSGILGFILAIVSLFGAGFLSYTYLVQTTGGEESYPIVEVLPISVVPKIATTTTTSKVATTTATTTTATKVATKTTTTTKTVTKEPVKIPVNVTTKTNGGIVTSATTTEKTVVTPAEGPLRLTTQTVAQTVALSVRGVIEYTNGARSLNGGLPALIGNETLNRMAQIKLDDMFAEQYFEHISPTTGVGPGDLAKVVRYVYVIVGENLALGDFGSDEKLVAAWMASPGHRANILNRYYQEIGVAVGMGIYEGRNTWLAVQSFGMPLSACPSIDAQMKMQIDNNNIQISNLGSQLDVKKAQIDSIPTSDPNYNIYVAEFNALLPEYNNLVESNKAIILTYNAQVQAYNNCVNSPRTN